jgi:septum formation protein
MEPKSESKTEKTPEGKYSKYDSMDDKKPFAVATNLRKNFAAKDYPSSPTDKLLSPCSRKLRRKQSKSQGSNDIEFWIPPDDIQIILGSSSIARAQIFDEMGWRYTVMNPDIDERAVSCSDPFRLPVLIAKAKAKSILGQLGPDRSPTVIITCDQIVLFQNEVRGKPENEQQARSFLQSYQDGAIVQTISAVVATHVPSGRQSAEIDLSTIHWSGIPESAINDLLVTKPDIYRSCGGFLIEDPDFVNFVDRIDGELDSIRGLPVKSTKKVIRSVLSSDI